MKRFKQGSISWAQDETLDGMPIMHEASFSKDFTLDSKYSIVSQKALSFTKNMCYLGTWSAQKRIQTFAHWGTGSHSWSMPVNVQIGMNSQRQSFSSDFNSALFYRKDRKQ